MQRRKPKASYERLHTQLRTNAAYVSSSRTSSLIIIIVNQGKVPQSPNLKHKPAKPQSSKNTLPSIERKDTPNLPKASKNTLPVKAIRYMYSYTYKKRTSRNPYQSRTRSSSNPTQDKTRQDQDARHERALSIHTRGPTSYNISPRR